MFEKKFKASLLHLLLSFLVVILILSFALYFWFPLKYLGITDFKEIVILIISIDLVLGPLLTFIIFKPAKKGLYLDLAIIAIFQASALSYGVYTLYQAHPVFITYKQNAFNLVKAIDVNPQDAKYSQFKVSKLTSGHIAFAKMPDDPNERMNIMMGVDLKGEPDIDQRAELYEPYTDHLDEILLKSIDPDSIFSNKEINSKIKSFLKKYPNIKNYSYIPLIGQSKNAIIVLDKKTAKPITTIDTNPLQYATLEKSIKK